ncbi:MAG TPA: hypothetical protein EYQ64_11010 [Gemmatimonadetes bacterium]|nr:hypothetical protein [Gemmatimonadota bacterium]
MKDRKIEPGDSTPSDDGSEDAGTPDDRDQTLGGYHDVHNRPPAFSGADAQPYTVSIEVESVENLAAPYVAYLVFPRWAETGLGIVDHVETPVLCDGKSRDEVQDRVHALPLYEVKRLLDEAIQRKAEKGAESDEKKARRG